MNFLSKIITKLVSKVFVELMFSLYLLMKNIDLKN